MGASSWRFYTTYKTDPEEALQQLRRDVFARGEYSFGFGGFAGPAGTSSVGPQSAGTPASGKPPADPTQILRAAAQLAGIEERLLQAIVTGDFSGLSAQEQQAAEHIRPLFQMAAAGQVPGSGEDDEEDDESFPDHPPETIDELLEMVAEDGTHSVLDIQQTGPELEFGIAAPMPSRRIAQFFGTEQPTHGQVEGSWADAAEGLDRWQAYYVTVYRDGQPHEYAFIGCSGD